MLDVEKSYYKAASGIFIINLFLGIPGGIGLAVLSRYLENSFGFFPANIALSMAFIIMSLHVLCKGICSPICGYMNDLYGRKFSVLVGGVISLIGSLCLLFSTFNILFLIILGTLIIGAGRGFFMTSFNVIAGDVGEKYRRVGHAESFADGLYLIGAILGGSSSLFLGDEMISFFILSTLMFIVAFIIIIFILKETKPENMEETETKFSYKSVLKHENFIPTFFYAFTVEGAESGYIATTIPILLSVIGVAESKAALFSTFPFSIGLGLFFLIAGYVNDRKGRKLTSLLGCSLIILFSVLAAIFLNEAASEIMIFIIVFLLSGSSSFVRSTIESTWTDVTSPINRGRFYGVFRFFNELGGVVHPLLMFFLTFLADLPIQVSAIIVIAFAITSLLIGKFLFKETLKKVKEKE
ncbi:MAG: MFS transporter [Candidatus Lokiarchaeota archaeon]|nr:MFS transporter [Candidatus Lokiarchaeota archaeon]